MSSSNQVNKRKSNPPTASDHVLGIFKHVEPNEGLDHVVRYFGTWSGTDKVSTERDRERERQRLEGWEHVGWTVKSKVEGCSRFSYIAWIGLQNEPEIT